MNFVVCHPRSGSEWLKLTLCKCGYKAEPYRHKRDRKGSVMFLHDGWGYLNGGRKIRGNGAPRKLGRIRRWSKEKIVVLARDPKDVMVSQWHFLKFRRKKGWVPDLYKFTKKFICNPINFLNRWDTSGLDKILVFYEDMTNDLPSLMRAVVEFFELDGSLLDNNPEWLSIDETEDLSFGESPKEQDVRARHCRRGEVGVWREYYSEDEIMWIENQCLQINPFFDRYRKVTK